MLSHLHSTAKSPRRGAEKVYVQPSPGRSGASAGPSGRLPLALPRAPAGLCSALQDVGAEQPYSPDPGSGQQSSTVQTAPRAPTARSLAAWSGRQLARPYSHCALSSLFPALLTPSIPLQGVPPQAASTTLCPWYSTQQLPQARKCQARSRLWAR